MSNSHHSSIALIILLVTFAILATAYSIVIPLGEAPDEVSHFSYVRYLATHLALPPAEGAVSGEAHQPPLYYLLGAALTAWIPEQQFDIIANPDWRLDDPSVPNVLLHTRREAFPFSGSALAWHLIRMLSVVMGGLTVWTTFRIAQLFFNDDRMALAVSALIAFLPGFTYLSATVNNDNLVITLAALALLVLLGQIRKPSLGGHIFVGVLLGLSVLAKISALPLWAVAFFALLFLVQDKPIRWRIQMTLVTGLVAVLVVSPWVIYNSMVFGDPINWSRFLLVTPRVEPMTLGDWLIYGDHMWKSLGGRFGGASHLEAPGLIYLVIATLLALALVGTLFLLRDWRNGKLSIFERHSLFIFGLIGILLLAAHIRLMMGISGMDQARHIFAGLPPFSIIVVASLLRLAPSQRKRVSLGLIGGMSIMALVTLVYVSNVFGSSANLVASAPQTPVADFNGEIQISAFRLEPRQATRGESVSLQIDWRAAQNVSEDYWLLIQLANGNEIAAQREGVPDNGRVTTDWWRAGQVFSSQHLIVVPADIAPGKYQLRLGLHPFGRWEWLPVRGGEFFTLATLEVR